MPPITRSRTRTLVAQQQAAAQQAWSDDLREGLEQSSHPVRCTNDVTGIRPVCGFSPDKQTHPRAPRQPPFRLLELPQELVDMMYRYMIYDGQVNILQTCREVYRGASPFMKSEAVLRIQPRSGRHQHRIRKFSNPGPLFKTVQHIELTIRTTADYKTSEIWNPECRMLYSLFLDDIPRQTCSVILWSDPTKHRFICLMPLNCFTITIKFEILTVLSILAPDSSRKSDRSILTPENAAIQDHIYRYSRRKLEPTQGPGSWQVGDAGSVPYLVFHPRLHAASKAEKKEESSD